MIYRVDCVIHLLNDFALDVLQIWILKNKKESGVRHEDFSVYGFNGVQKGRATEEKIQSTS